MRGKPIKSAYQNSLWHRSATGSRTSDKEWPVRLPIASYFGLSDTPCGAPVS